VTVVVMVVVVTVVLGLLVGADGADERRGRRTGTRARLGELGSDDDRTGDAERGQDSESVLREHR
jgi:hypothetical protein